MAATIWKPTIRKDGGPIYLAIADALAADIADGRLNDGTRLPTQRKLADALKIDFTTVSRAYAEAQSRGLIEGRVGQGTYVRARRQAAPKTRSTGIVDMSMNLPPRFANEALISKMWDVVAGLQDGGLDLLMRYQEPGGAMPDREAGASWLSRRLGHMTSRRVLVSSGAQAAFHAVLGVLAEPADVVLTESLTYPGLRSVASHLRLTLVPVEMDEHGMRPEALEQACERLRPKALYCMPTLHNPTTRTMPLARREAIVDIARRYALPILEDDAYGGIVSGAPSPLAVLAPELVYHIASLSKCLSPALRTAYLSVPDGRSAAKAISAIRSSASMVSPLTGAIATRWIEEGIADAVAREIAQESRARSDAARRIIASGLEASADGFHAWLALPPGWSRNQLVATLPGVGIGVVASDAFAVQPAPEAVRLGLGVPETLGELEASLEIVADVLSQAPAVSTMVV